MIAASKPSKWSMSRAGRSETSTPASSRAVAISRAMPAVPPCREPQVTSTRMEHLGRGGAGSRPAPRRGPRQESAQFRRRRDTTPRAQRDSLSRPAASPAESGSVRGLRRDGRSENRGCQALEQLAGLARLDELDEAAAAAEHEGDAGRESGGGGGLAHDARAARELGGDRVVEGAIGELELVAHVVEATAAAE